MRYKMLYDGPARELCLTLAKLCQATQEWVGARILHRAAEHLYCEHVGVDKDWRETAATTPTP